MHCLQVSVFRIFWRFSQSDKIYIQFRRGQIYTIVKVLLRQLHELCARLRCVLHPLFAHAHIILNGAGVDDRIFADPRAVEIDSIVEEQRLPLFVLPYGDDASDDVICIRGQRRPQQVFSVADGHARLARSIRQQPYVEVISHQPRPGLCDHTILRIQ